MPSNTQKQETSPAGMGHNLSPNKTIEDKAHGIGISSPYLYSILYAAAAGVKLANGVGDHAKTYAALENMKLISQPSGDIRLEPAGRSYLSSHFHITVKTEEGYETRERHPGTWVLANTKLEKVKEALLLVVK